MDVSTLVDKYYETLAKFVDAKDISASAVSDLKRNLTSVMTQMGLNKEEQDGILSGGFGNLESFPRVN